MSADIYQPLIAAAIALGVAVLAYLAAWVRANTKRIDAHDAQIAARPNEPARRSPRASDLAGGGVAQRPAPLWNQLADPLPTGALPYWRYEECGEECVAELVYQQHGVEVSADALRAQLGGPGRRGLTTGQDLVRLLARCNVDATLLEIGADNAAAQLQAATADGRSGICLGHWLAPAILHWVLVTRADSRGCGYNDPWGGHRIAATWAEFLPRYAGEIVLVLRAPDRAP